MVGTGGGGILQVTKKTKDGSWKSGPKVNTECEPRVGFARDEVVDHRLSSLFLFVFVFLCFPPRYLILSFSDCWLWPWISPAPPPLIGSFRSAGAHLVAVAVARWRPRQAVRPCTITIIMIIMIMKTEKKKKKKKEGSEKRKTEDETRSEQSIEIVNNVQPYSSPTDDRSKKEKKNK